MRPFVVALLLLAAAGRAGALTWHGACMCELTDAARHAAEADEAALAAAAADGGKLDVTADGAAVDSEVQAECTAAGEAAVDTAMPALFEATHYATDGGAVRRFCECGVETVQSLNDRHVYPVLERLRRTPFFRFYRVALLQECPFWKEDGYCMIRDCSVAEQGGKAEDLLADVDRAHDHDTVHEGWPSELDASWTNEDRAVDMHYVDLVGNPERYTGYKGDSPHAIWHEVHSHNTLAALGHEGDATAAELARMDTEARVFYRILSGVHASISSHISAQYLLNEDAVRARGVEGVWGPHLGHYRRRLGQHPDRVSNLYFVYLLALRAVNVSAPFLAQYDYGTGHADDAATRGVVLELLESAPRWPLTMDESIAFDAAAHAAGESHLVRAFRDRVYNISRLMDCVGCERCRLWGKLQVMGLGTALRILYAPDRDVVFRSLHRNHVVALVNWLARLSHSVRSTHLLGGLLMHADIDTDAEADAEAGGGGAGGGGGRAGGGAKGGLGWT